MATALEETVVSYEELAELEREFDDAETEMIRKQWELTRPLYEKRQKIASKIPNFWPLVVEQAPIEIDDYIQPSDSAILLNYLSSISVIRFELEEKLDGEPRSFAIRWEFAPNDHFEDGVIEKKFWYRKGPNNWAGLVSEPVEIKWKRGKDPTGGLLGLARRAWEENQEWRKANPGKEKPRSELTETQRTMKSSLENTGIGRISFFAWFGYVGHWISAEDSNKEAERRRKIRDEELCTDKARVRPSGEGGNEDDEENVHEDEDEDDDEDEDELEIFPGGDDLAICIAEDLWSGAIKYFTQAQELDALSDADFEDSDDEMLDSSQISTPKKLRKT